MFYQEQFTYGDYDAVGQKAADVLAIMGAIKSHSCFKNYGPVFQESSVMSFVKILCAAGLLPGQCQCAMFRPTDFNALIVDCITIDTTDTTAQCVTRLVFANQAYVDIFMRLHMVLDNIHILTLTILKRTIKL